MLTHLNWNRHFNPALSSNWYDYSFTSIIVTVGLLNLSCDSKCTVTYFILWVWIKTNKSNKYSDIFCILTWRQAHINNKGSKLRVTSDWYWKSLIRRYIGPSAGQLKVQFWAARRGPFKDHHFKLNVGHKTLTTHHNWPMWVVCSFIILSSGGMLRSSVLIIWWCWRPRKGILVN